MTNNEIIMNHAFALREAGLINGTGRYVTAVDGDGNEKQIEIPEAIHTFAEWKRSGYIVRRGEHAVASFPIWKPVARRTEEETEDGENAVTVNQKMIMVKASFFAAHQVDPIKQ